MLWISAWTRNIGFFVMLTFVFLLFPTGKLLPGNWRVVAWLAGIFTVMHAVVAAFKPGMLSFAPNLNNPYALVSIGELLIVLELILSAVMLGVIGACIASAIVRFRGATGDERTQLKWFAYSAGLIGIVLTAYAIMSPLEASPDVQAYKEIMLVLSIATMPIAIGIAILKYRLYDIDLIINRTLVYVPLTAILAGLYAALNKILENLFISITGDKSDAAIVLTTLILAASFSPIKGGMQKLVDRLFKEAPDTTRGLRALGEELESRLYPVDKRLVARRFLNEAVRALQAQSGAIYLTRNESLELVHSLGEWDEGKAEVTVRLDGGGTSAGLLQLGPRLNGVEYREEEREALADVARVVADAMRDA